MRSRRLGRDVHTAANVIATRPRLATARSPTTTTARGAGPGCAELRRRLLAGQRYCLECGSGAGRCRRSSARWLSIVARRRPRRAPAAPTPAAVAPPRTTRAGDALHALAAGGGGRGDGMLAVGVLLGSATSPLAQSAGFAPIVLEQRRSAAGAQPGTGRNGGANRCEPPAAVASTARRSRAAPAPEQKPNPKPPGAKKLPPELPEEPETPAAGQARLPDRARRPRLRRSLRQGLDRSLPREDAAGTGRAALQLLRGDQGELANQIALISGQGPTPETAANCPELHRRRCPARSAPKDRWKASGCVYPATTADAAGPAGRGENELEGLRRGHRQRRGGPADQLPPPGARRPRPPRRRSPATLMRPGATRSSTSTR